MCRGAGTVSWLGTRCNRHVPMWGARKSLDAKLVFEKLRLKTGEIHATPGNATLWLSEKVHYKSRGGPVGTTRRYSTARSLVTAPRRCVIGKNGRLLASTIYHSRHDTQLANCRDTMDRHVKLPRVRGRVGGGRVAGYDMKIGLEVEVGSGRVGCEASPGSNPVSFPGKHPPWSDPQADPQADLRGQPRGWTEIRPDPPGRGLRVEGSHWSVSH